MTKKSDHTFPPFYVPEPTPTVEPIESEYPGITIDQKFPIIEEHSIREEEFRDKNYSISSNGLNVLFHDFTPLSINKGAKRLIQLKTLRPGEYRGNLVGVSHLLGKNSNEIYVIATGPGGPCCTNYWILDVSGKSPRLIFQSEEFGSFRDPMEIFDEDEDGVFEIVQFDSKFRYFLGDCGSCSPEPRAVFKYNKKAGKYLPAKGSLQEFVKESNKSLEKSIIETAFKINETRDESLKYELKRSVPAYVVDLIYLGEEIKAWKLFDKYFPNDFNKKETRNEIKRLLKQSEFYRALRRN